MDPFEFGKNLVALATSAERKYGLPERFLLRLLAKEDDWAFCLQLHALVESAVTTTLLRFVQRQGLDEFLRSLPLNRKAELIKKLGATIDHPFVQQLSTLRNKLAHRVEEIPTFAFAPYVSSLTPDHRKQLIGDPATVLDRMALLDTGAVRLFLWMQAMRLIDRLIATETAEEQRRRKELEEAVTAHEAVRDQLRREALMQLLDVGPGSLMLQGHPPTVLIEHSEKGTTGE